MIHNTFKGSWRMVNKGTGQVTVSGPHLFKIFLEWFQINCMTCSPIKCKELTFLKKGSNADALYPPTADIPQCKKLQSLGVCF